MRHRSSCSARRRARGGAGEAGREAHASIPILPRHSTLSASSAVRPAAQASSRQQAFLFSLSRNATGLDKDDTAGLDAFDCYRRMRSPDAAIRAVRRSQHLETEQHLAPAQAAEPAILTPAVPAPHLQPSVPKGRSPARPAVGPLSSESTVPTIRQPRACSTVPCVAATPPYLFSTIFKSTTAMQHSHRVWFWPAR